MSSTSGTAWEWWYKGHSFTENKCFATFSTEIKKKKKTTKQKKPNTHKKNPTDLSSLIVCFWKISMRADLQAVHPRERRRASELLSVARGKKSSYKKSRWYTTLGFNHARLRAPCLNTLSATSALKAYGKGGDKDNRAASSTRGAARKAVTHTDTSGQLLGETSYIQLRLAVVLRSQEAGLSRW